MKRITLLMACTFAALAQQPGPPPPPKLYIQPRVNGQNRNSSAHMVDALMKRCPAAVTITNLPEAGQYQLEIAGGHSILFDKAGNPVTSFGAHLIPTLAKDVCNYFEGTTKEHK
jgi:hypothetical protein